jgi:hypothetical protein
MNLRIVAAGTMLVGLAVASFLGMATIAPKSTDPAAMLQTVGTVSGAAGGLGIVMVIFRALRKTR